ncbi:MAG TPA: phage tail sheath subtilisin-like domain-containing protein, partial [Myxococcota bacterium]|nr:phage tail sheath subtilisin-like domain-containing protein [Myxococcota bacterium]
PLAASYSITGGSDGAAAVDVDDFKGDELDRTGLHALDGLQVNLVSLPGRNEVAYLSALVAYVDKRGDCMAILDGPGASADNFSVSAQEAKAFVDALPFRSKNAAMFYPWVKMSDPVGVGRAPTRFVAPSGVVAGIFARTDNNRGVWKAPAGIDAVVTGALGLQYDLTDAEQDTLNPIGLNCFRAFPGTGIVLWGSRCLTADAEWRYIPVRRTALFLMESLKIGMKWAVFEPNDTELWGRIRTNIYSFMLTLFREGAFQGRAPEDAFLVACDRATNPQESVDAGVVTAKVAFAPLKPAEFVVIQVSQKALLS